MKTGFNLNAPIKEYKYNVPHYTQYIGFKSNINNLQNNDILNLSTPKNLNSENSNILNSFVTFTGKLFANEEKNQSADIKNATASRPVEPKKELHNLYLYQDYDKISLDRFKTIQKIRADYEEIKPLLDNTRIRVCNTKAEDQLRGSIGTIENYRILVGSQSGSNTGFWAERIRDGEFYYIKTKNTQQNIVEYITSQFYRAAGIDTPEVSILSVPRDKNSDKPYNEYWVKSKAIVRTDDITYKPEAAYEGFAVDAWLANWDAVISDNTIVKDEHAVRIDFGGALDFRAKGKRKDLTNKVTEITTLIDPNRNYRSSKIFSNMTRDDLINSLKRVQSVTDDDFIKIYKACSCHVSPEIFTTLKNRQKYLGWILDAAEKTPREEKESLLNYVRKLENITGKEHKAEIKKFDEDKEKRMRIMKEMSEQRDILCTDEDLKQLWKVKISTCNPINQLCSYGEDNSHFMIKPLDHALSLVSLTEDAVLYRADRICRDTQLNARYANDLKEFKKNKFCFEKDLPSMDELIGKIYQKDKIVEEKEFISTSLDENVAKSFLTDKAILYKFNAKKGLKATCLEHLPSKVIPEKDNIKTLALCNNNILEGNEEEILVKNGFKYQMKNLTFEDGHYVIECDIL